MSTPADIVTAELGHCLGPPGTGETSEQETAPQVSEIAKRAIKGRGNNKCRLRFPHGARIELRDFKDPNSKVHVWLPRSKTISSNEARCMYAAMR